MEKRLSFLRKEAFVININKSHNINYRIERTESNQLNVIDENDPHDGVISALSIKANTVLDIVF